MIKKLYIKNMAIIDELSIKFADKLNIITGETGSGKSLIVKAIQILIGGKINKDTLRSGELEMVIEGEFIVNNEEYIIRRLYNISGKSKSYINNKLANKSKIKKLGQILVDIHGQHDQQHLLDTSTHLNYLDSFGNYNNDLFKLKEYYSERIKLLNDIKLLNELNFDNQKNIELYNFQLNEINQINLKNIDESEINSKYVISNRSIEISETLKLLENYIDKDEYSISKLMSKVLKEVLLISKYVEEFEEIIDRVNTISIDFEDILLSIEQTKNKMQIDKDEMLELESTIEHVQLIKRKYGGSIKSAIDYERTISKKLDEINNYDSNIDKQNKKLKNINKKLLQLSKKISRIRKNNSKIFKEKVEQYLNELNMSSTHLFLKLDEIDIVETGQDSCRFLISTNTGETPKDLSSTISGGELSRIMLAIKLVMQNKDLVKTLIFDEIDLGISGQVADQVGNQIQDLTESHQIICITHLSQIAGKGSNHIKIKKIKKDGRVFSVAKKLNNHERIIEIASLISGKTITDLSKQQARELIINNG
tara:strand:+ start:99 stop:1709 length:1611 start_codon:yes stop_codon:yes gene_type:complete